MEMRKTVSFLVLPLLLACLIAGCKEGRRHLIIGVAQCSEDVWRDKLNDELTMAAYAYEDIELRIVSAGDDSERQMQQISDFIKQGVDLIIVSPNQLSSISYAIDKAEKNGIPVILFDRKSDTDNYTAFIGADNYEMGYQIGKFIAGQMQERGKVLEIMGLKGSSPAIERHKGFVCAINEYPDIRIVDTLEGDWTEKSGREAMEAFLKTGDASIDFVFAQNDRMAAGARRVLPDVSYCGIDGLAVRDGGLEQVKMGDLTCTYIYPTSGDRVFELALKILEGRSFERDNYLQSALVTKENAALLLMQAEEIERQTVNLKAIHKLASKYLNQYHLQRAIILLLIILMILLAVFFAFFLWVRKTKTALSEAVESQKAELEKSYEQQHKLGMEIERISSMQTPFVRSLLSVCTDHLANTEFNVNQLADEMAMSRVQLYRKVKLHTGMSVVDFIRSNRLEHARQLFDETDLNVSQVADQVGFATLQYFIKCFRKEYGCTPNEYIKSRAAAPW